MGLIGDMVYVAGSILVDGIKDFFSGSSSNDYSPRASITAEHSKSNADILAEMKAEVKDVTKKKEKEIIDYINKSMDSLLKSLEKVNGQSFGGKTLNINIREIKSKNETLKKGVVGFIGSYMDDRLVLSNHELVEILKILDDEKRKKKFDAFYIKLQKQAVKKLQSKVEETVHKQEEVIRKEIENRLEDVDRNMQESTKAYEEILHMKEEQEDAKIEEKQIQYCYQYELTDILLEQLES